MSRSWFVLDKLLKVAGSIGSVWMPRLAKPDQVAKAIGRRVRELRAERGLTMERLAYENGISKGTVSDLERGLARPSVLTLQRIADGLGVELLDLFTRPTLTERHRIIDLTRGASVASLRAAAILLRERKRNVP